MESLSRETTPRWPLKVSALGPEATPVLTLISAGVFSPTTHLNERRFNVVGPLLARPDRGLIVCHICVKKLGNKTLVELHQNKII